MQGPHNVLIPRASNLLTSDSNFNPELTSDRRTCRLSDSSAPTREDSCGQCCPAIDTNKDTASDNIREELILRREIKSLSEEAAALLQHTGGLQAIPDGIFRQSRSMPNLRRQTSSANASSEISQDTFCSPPGVTLHKDVFDCSPAVSTGNSVRSESLFLPRPSVAAASDAASGDILQHIPTEGLIFDFSLPYTDRWQEVFTSSLLDNVARADVSQRALESSKLIVGDSRGLRLPLGDDDPREEQFPLHVRCFALEACGTHRSIANADRNVL